MKRTMIFCHVITFYIHYFILYPFIIYINKKKIFINELIIFKSNLSNGWYDCQKRILIKSKYHLQGCFFVCFA